MSRNVASLRDAFTNLTNSQTQSQVLSYPSGHFVGFYLGIENGQLVVGPGEANVNGAAVKLKSNTSVEEQAWAISRERDHIYYLYLTRQGTFYVDNADPTWLAVQNGWYHPVTGYRYLGLFYNDDGGQIIYKLSSHYDVGTQIVVGAKGYAGYVDYECDGVDDQKQVNDALKYCAASAQAKEVVLRGGTFYTSAAIEMRSNTALVGDNATIEKNCNDYAIEIVGTSLSRKINISIRDIKITRNSADTNTERMVYSYYGDNVLIENVIVDDSYASAVYISQTTNATVRNCYFVDCKALGLTFNSSSGIIENNDFTATETVNDDVRAIVLVSASGTIVSNNRIHDMDINEGFLGIALDSGDNAQVSGNQIDDIKYRLTAVTDNAYGIRVITSDECVVTENKIQNIADYGQSTAVGAAIDVAAAACESNIIRGNSCISNGNVVDRGNCESATEPAMNGEVAVVTSDATFARSNAQAYAGTYSYLFTKTSAEGAYGVTALADSTDTADLHGFVPGQTYTVGAWVYIPSGGATGPEVMVGIRYYNAAAWSFDSQAAAATYDAWQYVEEEVTIPATATGAYPRLYMETTASPNETFYIDNIRVMPNGTWNYHDQQFSNSGTGTIIKGNSWEIWWDDIRIGVGALKFGGVGTDPAYATFMGTLNVKCFAVGEELQFETQLPHSYKEGSTLTCHAHWTPLARGNEEISNTVAWMVEYTAAADGATFPAIATLNLTDYVTGSDNLHERTPEVSFSGYGLGISSMIVGKIYRAADTWASTSALPGLLEMDFHFQMDTPGSVAIATK